MTKAGVRRCRVPSAPGPGTRSPRPIERSEGESTADRPRARNVIDRCYNKKKNLSRGLKWQELMCRIEGPVVASIDLVFSTDWYLESGDQLVAPVRDTPALVRGDLACQVVPSGLGFQVENNLQLFLSLLYSARERIIITSPYFVPDDSNRGRPPSWTGWRASRLPCSRPRTRLRAS